MKQIFFLFITIILHGCITHTDKGNSPRETTSKQDSFAKSYIDTIRALENQSTIPDYDSLGQLVSKIRFDVKTNNLEDFPDGKVPWIRIDSPQVDIKNLIGKDEVIIHESKITIIIDYPLSSNYIFELISIRGFTRKQLISEISKHYYELYDEEEKTATVKTVPLKDRKIYNRNQTNGKYGIWGHDIGDLVLDEIHVHKNSNGEVILTLELES